MNKTKQKQTKNAQTRSIQFDHFLTQIFLFPFLFSDYIF